MIGLLLLLLLSTGALMHISGGPRELIRVARGVDPVVLAASFFLLSLAEIVKAWRLSLIGERLGVKIPLTVSTIARFSGRMVGVLTPAYSGATPTRSLIVSAYTGRPPGVTFGIATMESLMDTLISVTVVIVMAIPYLPESWLMLLVALCIGGSWIGGLLWARSDSFERVINRIKMPENFRCYILGQRKLFLESLREASRLGILSVSVLVTLGAHIVEAMGLLVVLKSGLYYIASPLLVLRAFLLMEATYVLSMSITPGGALFFEYGLAGLMDPRSLLTWRVVYLAFSLLPGLVIALTVSRVRRYISEALEQEIKGCEEGGEGSESI